ncbi:ATP-dependent DNA helicase PIF1-like protein [Tanacetum coccineum]
MLKPWLSQDLPEEILIDAADDSVTSIVDFTYLNILDNINDSYFQEKVILASTNEVVDNMNEHLLEKFPGEEIDYLSSDSEDKNERNAAMDQSIFSPGFINGLKFLGIGSSTNVCDTQAGHSSLSAVVHYRSHGASRPGGTLDPTYVYLHPTALAYRLDPVYLGAKSARSVTITARAFKVAALLGKPPGCLCKPLPSFITGAGSFGA